jgi:CBS domain-containing protein
MNVQHFMTQDPVAVDVADSCADVAHLMKQRGLGAVVVLQNGRVAGILTDRQLAIDGCSDERHPRDIPAAEVMTPNPATLTLEDNLFSAVDTFRSAGVVHRIPVVNAEKELLGVVSLSDLAVIAKDLIDAIMLDQTHHAMQEAQVLTGGKRIVKHIRRPTKLERLPREQELRVVTQSSIGAPASRERTKTGRDVGEHGRRGRTSDPMPARTGSREGRRRGSTRATRKRAP